MQKISCKKCFCKIQIIDVILQKLEARAKRTAEEKQDSKWEAWSETWLDDHQCLRITFSSPRIKLASAEVCDKPTEYCKFGSGYVTVQSNHQRRTNATSKKTTHENCQLCSSVHEYLMKYVHVVQKAYVINRAKIITTCFICLSTDRYVAALWFEI